MFGVLDSFAAESFNPTWGNPSLTWNLKTREHGACNRYGVLMCVNHATIAKWIQSRMIIQSSFSILRHGTCVFRMILSQRKLRMYAIQSHIPFRTFNRLTYFTLTLSLTARLHPLTLLRSSAAAMWPQKCESVGRVAFVVQGKWAKANSVHWK